MKTAKHPDIVWKKGETVPCAGSCGHPHVAKSGPCTKTGCGCTASKTRKGKT